MNKVELLKSAKPFYLSTKVIPKFLEGGCFNTRKLVKPQPEFKNGETGVFELFDDGNFELKIDGYASIYDYPVKASFYKDDIIYVKEAWNVKPPEDGGGYIYKASTYPPEFYDWKSPVSMPKEAARLFLRITKVSIKRLQDITEKSAIREGISRIFDNRSDEEYNSWAARTKETRKKEDWDWNNYLWHGHHGNCGAGNKLSDAWEYQGSGYDNPIESFSSLWNCNLPFKEWKDFGWTANPWVWVYDFEVIQPDD